MLIFLVFWAKGPVPPASQRICRLEWRIVVSGTLERSGSDGGAECDGDL